MILTARSPVFQAAMGALGHDPDPLATLVQLRDAYPKATHQAIQATVRETAVAFHAAGIAPQVIHGTP